MTDEIKKTVFKAPQIPKNVPAISQGSVIHQEKPQNQTENVSKPAPVATPAQGTSEEKGKNFVKDLNLPPKIMETKVMAAIVAGIMVFGMMMGCMMFGGEEKRVVQGLTDVVINPDIQKNLWRFDIGQCSKFDTPEKELSMVFQSNILKNKRVETNISLDTPEGEITSFHTLYNIDDSLNIIGIPGYVFNEAWENNGIEYIIVMRPRLVQMVK